MSSLEKIKQHLFSGDLSFLKELEKYNTAIDNAINDSELKKTALPILKLFNLKEKTNGYRPGIEFRKSLVETIDYLTDLLNNFDRICNCLKSKNWIFSTKDLDYKQEKNYETVCKNVLDAIKNSTLNQTELTIALSAYGQWKYMDDYKNKKSNITNEKTIKGYIQTLVQKICTPQKPENIFEERMKGVFSKSNLPISMNWAKDLIVLTNIVSGESSEEMKLADFQKICKDFNECIINLKPQELLDVGPDSDYGYLQKELKKIVNNLSDKNRNVLFIESLRKKVVDYITKRFAFNGREL